MPDLTAVILVTHLLLPVMVLAGLRACVKDGSFVPHREWRRRLKGRLLTILRFCTMPEARDVLGNLLSNAEWPAHQGCFLRNTGFDELPAWLNVFQVISSPDSQPPESPREVNPRPCGC